MTWESPFPDRTYEGGVLPVNSDRIEKRLSEIWSMATNSGEDAGNLVKICLANIVVICDGLSRPEAELLSVAIAREHPSRVILTVIDEELKSYYSFVRTSCTRDPGTGIIRCWEIIELVSETARLHSVVSAMRSLLVDSVPVVTVDFRPFHSTPELDETVAGLTDLALVNTDVVPTEAPEHPFLALRWYRTLPIRLLLGDLFSLVGQHCSPAQFTVYTETGVDTFDDLVVGWLVARIHGTVERTSPADLRLRSEHGVIRIACRERMSGESKVMAIEFAGGAPPATVTLQDSPDGHFYRLAMEGRTLVRSLAEWPLANYIVGLLTDASELKEYEAVVEKIVSLRNRL